MAIKDKPQGALDSVESINSVAVIHDTTNGQRPLSTQYDGYSKFIYMGPSIPLGRLKERAVLEGSFSQVMDFISQEVEAFPQVRHLVIPINRLGEYATKVSNKGNIINKYYYDIVSLIKKDSKED